MSEQQSDDPSKAQLGPRTYPSLELGAGVWYGLHEDESVASIAARLSESLSHSLHPEDLALLQLLQFRATQQEEVIRKKDGKIAELESELGIDAKTHAKSLAAFSKDIDALKQQLVSGETRRETDVEEVVVVTTDLMVFKELNDNGGHGLGDSALEAYGSAAQAVLSSYRKKGVTLDFYRIGGDEFALIAKFTHEADVNDREEYVHEILSKIDANQKQIFNLGEVSLSAERRGKVQQFFTPEGGISHRYGIVALTGEKLTPEGIEDAIELADAKDASQHRTSESPDKPDPKSMERSR